VRNGDAFLQCFDVRCRYSHIWSVLDALGDDMWLLGGQKGRHALINLIAWIRLVTPRIFITRRKL
jgi:hypothetical protein